jgi:hypothetical protein
MLACIEMMEPLPEFAATLAPEVDRAFIAGHTAARPFARVLAARLALNGFGILVDLRLPLLHSRGMSYAEARAIQRYIDPDQTQAGIDEVVARGLIAPRDGRWLPTELGRGVLDGLTAGLVDGTATLWSEQGVSCSTVIKVATTVIDTVSASPESLPAFRAVLAGRPPTGFAVPYTCWWCVAALRYLRADDHAAAWMSAGLDAPGASVLTHLCHNHSAQSVTEIGDRVAWRGSLGAALDRLRSAKLIEEAKGGWSATEAGRRMRGAIESATNDRNGAWYRVVTADRSAELLDKLRDLRQN